MRIKVGYLQGAETLGTGEDFQLGVNAPKSLQTVWRDSLQLEKQRQAFYFIFFKGLKANSFREP